MPTWLACIRSDTRPASALRSSEIEGRGVLAGLHQNVRTAHSLISQSGSCVPSACAAVLYSVARCALSILLCLLQYHNVGCLGRARFTMRTFQPRAGHAAHRPVSGIAPLRTRRTYQRYDRSVKLVQVCILQRLQLRRLHALPISHASECFRCTASTNARRALCVRSYAHHCPRKVLAAIMLGLYIDNHASLHSEWVTRAELRPLVSALPTCMLSSISASPNSTEYQSCMPVNVLRLP